MENQRETSGLECECLAFSFAAPLQPPALSPAVLKLSSLPYYPFRYFVMTHIHVHNELNQEFFDRILDRLNLARELL